MICQQCGAPMVLNRDRDYYFCEYCGSYHFPDSTEEGIRDLGENPERINCPVCKIPFNLATFDNHFRGYQCNNCQGILFNRNTFRNTIESRRARATTPPDPPTRFYDEELHRRVGCPKCGKTMENHLYLGPGSIVIDTCGTCNLIWLDHGELDKVINAPGSDRGRGVQRITQEYWEKSREDEKKKKENQDGINLIEFLNDILS